MSAKSRMRAFGAAFSAGGEGINKILEAETAAENFETKRKLEDRKVKVDEAQQKSRDRTETKLAEIQAGLAKLQERRTVLMEEAGKRAQDLHPGTLAAQAAAFVRGDIEKDILMTKALQVKKELDTYRSPADLQNDQFTFAEGMARMKNQMAVSISGLKFRQDKLFQDRAFGHQFGMEAMKSAERFYSIPGLTGQGERFKSSMKASRAAANDFLDEADISYNETQAAQIADATSKTRSDIANASVNPPASDPPASDPSVVGGGAGASRQGVVEGPPEAPGPGFVDPEPGAPTQGGAAATGVTSSATAPGGVTPSTTSGAQAPAPFTGVQAPQAPPPEAPPLSPAQQSAVDPEAFVMDVIQRGALGGDITMDDVALVDQIGSDTGIVQQLIDAGKLTQHQVDKYLEQIKVVSAQAVKNKEMTQEEERQRRRRMIQNGIQSEGGIGNLGS